MQNLNYMARLENELGNANSAMRYARTALQKRSCVTGRQQRGATKAIFINNFIPKYLEKDALNFRYAAYGADLR